MVRGESSAGSWKSRLRRLHPEGIPWPACHVYNALTRSRIFQEHYHLLAMDVGAHCPEGLLLDVGTGPARLPIALCRLLPDIQVVGVDISEPMVAQARENVRRARPDQRIHIQKAAATELPFVDNHFDAVVSSGSLHHFKQATTALDEIHRVLKPGGTALIYDLVRELPAEVRERLRRKFGTLRMSLLRLHSFEEPFYDLDEMAALPRSTRFGKGETRFVGAMCCLMLTKPDIA